MVDRASPSDYPHIVLTPTHATTRVDPNDSHEKTCQRHRRHTTAALLATVCALVVGATVAIAVKTLPTTYAPDLNSTDKKDLANSPAISNHATTIPSDNTMWEPLAREPPTSTDAPSATIAPTAKPTQTTWTPATAAATTVPSAIPTWEPLSREIIPTSTVAPSVNVATTTKPTQTTSTPPTTATATTTSAAPITTTTLVPATAAPPTTTTAPRSKPVVATPAPPPLAPPVTKGMATGMFVFQNNCGTPVGLYRSHAVIASLAPGESLQLDGTKQVGQMFHFGWDSAGDATLFETTFGADGRFYYDISIIPVRCGASWDFCTGPTSFNLPMTVTVRREGDTNVEAFPTCKSLQCASATCPVAYKVPNDVRTMVCPKQVAMTITAC